VIAGWEVSEARNIQQKCADAPVSCTSCAIHVNNRGLPGSFRRFRQTKVHLIDTCWSGVVVSALASINEVNQRRARLVLR